MELRSGFVSHLRTHYPGLASALDDRPELISENLLSPFAVTLPRSLRQDIEASVRAVHRLRQCQARSASGPHQPVLSNPGNFSTMMSLDFHVDETGRLKLIEINTNAAFLIMSWEMYRFRGIENPVRDFHPDRWRQDLQEELQLNRARFGRNNPAEKPRLVIADETPERQRLFVEFLVAREWARAWGWDVEIRDFKDVPREPRPDLVYNRCTDFLFAQPEHQKSKELFLSGEACFSPNPFEYDLLADKQRLIEWSRPGHLESLGVDPETRAIIRGILPLAIEVSADNAEDVWSRRKTLFFKPKREFGSKKAFRGSSISRKTFEGMLDENILAQEFVPPRELEFQGPAGPVSLKYDLRCHFYQDRLEGVFARLYQGQVTNLQTPLGGFTPVVFE